MRLSNPCTSDGDLVPSCVNPVLAASATLAAGAATVTRAVRAPLPV
ncbi:hypothetical protein ACFWUZ_22285 [Streptomyces sp. NPDC058646]